MKVAQWINELVLFHHFLFLKFDLLTRMSNKPCYHDDKRGMFKGVLSKKDYHNLRGEYTKAKSLTHYLTC
jgi:hypothetical protein